MGSFAGHVIPGSFFVVLSLSYLADTLHKYFRPEHKEAPFQSRVLLYVTCCQRQIALTAWCIVISCPMGIATELMPFDFSAGLGGEGKQHVTMYASFGIIGLLALVMDLLPPLPQRRQLEYISLVMALVVEAILFKFHLGGRNAADVAVHTLLLYTIYATVIVTLLELWLENSLMLALGRSYLTMLQGTWFIQLGFILYDPWSKSLDEMVTLSQDKQALSHHVIMGASATFTWHVTSAFIFYSATFVLCHAWCGHRRGPEYIALTMTRGTVGDSD